MRALKTLLIILAGIGLLIVILGLTGQRTYRVERSTVIAADADEVYPYVSTLAAMKEWGPWQAMDPDQVQQITGTDGTVGAVWSWAGETVGKGSQTLTGLEPGRSVRSSLRFTEPFESESEVSYELEVADGGTRVIWANWGENDFMGRVLAHFNMMERMLGPDFEQGLANLKELVERETAQHREELALRTVNGYQVETVQRPQMVYVGQRAKVKFKDLAAFFERQYSGAGAAIGQAQLEMAGPASALYFDWDERTATTDVMAAFPVRAEKDLVLPGMQVHVAPAGKAYHIAHSGAYATLGDAHAAFEAMLERQGSREAGCRIEEYLVGPPQQPDTTRWVTHLYCMLDQSQP